MERYRDRDAVEFLPDALAIRHEPLPFWARSGLLWMGLFFLLALVWACLGKVDVIVTAGGRLVSDHPTIVMKPLERTVLKQVHVAVGDRVKAGQDLASFDPVFSRADSERLATEVRLYQAQFDRLFAESLGRAYVLPSEPKEEELWQASIYRDRSRFHTEKMQYYARELERIEKTLAATRENLILQRERLKTYKQIEGMVSGALQSQSASLRTLKETQIARMQLEAEISDKANQLLVLESERKARMAERDAFSAQWKIETSREMVQTREALTKALKEYDKANQMASYVALRAPEEAVVHDIAPISIGSAVREAETLLTLVPLGGRLEVEAEIRAEDIGKVRVGDCVRVKVTAFPFQKYGTLEGKVRVISKDAFSRTPEDSPASMSQAGAAFYRARVELAPTGSDEDGLLSRLIPGMETQCEIRVGGRRVIEYLIHPIIKSLDEAIREP